MSSGINTGIDEVTALLHHSFDPSPLPEPFRLSVIEGPDAGKTFALDGSQPSRVLVGTAAACSVRLSDRTVSRRHVALDIVGRRVRIFQSCLEFLVDLLEAVPDIVQTGGGLYPWSFCMLFQ